MFQASLDSIDSQVAIIDAQGTIVYVNRAWREFGYANGVPKEHEFLGKSYIATCTSADVSGDIDGATVTRGILAVIRQDVAEFEHEYPCHSPTEKRWFMMRAAPLLNHPGRFIVTHFNTTRRKEKIIASERALHEAMFHTQAILDNIVDGVITIDENGLIQTFNQAAVLIFGYDAGEVALQNVSMLMPQPDRGRHDGYLKAYQVTRVPRIIGKAREMIGMRKNGNLFPMSLAVSQVEQGGRITYVGVVRDISLQKSNEEEIRRLAFFDTLTGLPNRRLLLDRIRHALINAARSGQHGAIMFLDLDNFKAINDRLGHDMGDNLLQQAARHLQSCVREGDSVARLGGDEFVVLLEGLSLHTQEAANQAKLVCSKILELLSGEYLLGTHSYQSSVSVGLVVFTNADEDLEELMKKADIAMYQAKSAGRNGMRFFDPDMQAAVNVHAALEQDIRRALQAKEFALHYQLQVDRYGKFTGVEALARWNHSVRGMVSPAQFIPVAEETGVIVPLGQWVMEAACGQLVHWSMDDSRKHWTMSVNVSASQFSQRDFVQQVAKALTASGANPQLLKLELTESMLVSDVDDIVDKMVAVRRLGVHFSLDDFGTGYSSLAYLKRLPLSQLKVDQSFVRDVLTDASDAVIVRTIVALGHSLGLSVIAEGVETLAQSEFLADLGCDAFQGYYFARPVPSP